MVSFTPPNDTNTHHEQIANPSPKWTPRPVFWSAGPTRLMLALWATQYNIKARIIDSKPNRIPTGHADGPHSETLKILDSFGLIDGFLSRACRINEICAWVRISRNRTCCFVWLTQWLESRQDSPNRIERSHRVKSQASNSSRFPQLSLSRGILDQIIRDYLQAHEVHIERRTTLEQLEIDQKAAAMEDYHSVQVEL